jgi:hypothetical protein
MFSQPSAPVNLNDRTLRLPNCLGLEDLISREPQPPSTNSACFFAPLVDFATAIVLKLSRCEGLVANRSCARGTLQVVELCIKAVKKGIRV